MCAVEMRSLGSTGLVSSSVGLTCLGFSGAGGAVDGTANKLISHALDCGVTLIDATAVTGGGDVESLVGRAVRGRRDEAVLAARCGARFTHQGELVHVDARPDSIARSCDASLRRLGVDHLDLYYLARADPRVELADTVDALSGLVRDGKVRQIGLSGVTAGQLRDAHAVHPIAAVVGEYSLLDRRVEAEILPTARALGVGFIARSPLDRGLLTGRATAPDDLADDDCRRGHPRFHPAAFAHNRHLIRAAERLAASKDVSLGRLALAWLLAQGEDIVAMPGTRDRTHLEMNVAATEVRLEPEECARLSALLAPDRIAGAAAS
jgi:aryl-alcohol dehydrogenase-like predicted oxidoreductase